MVEMKTLDRRINPMGVAFPLAVAVGLLLAVAQAEPARPAVVGTPICMTCHSSFAKLWASLRHSEAMLADTLPADKRGCEACHGAGSVHVSKDRAQITSWAKLDGEAQAKVCLQCHAKQGLSSDLWFARGHAAVTTCTECHEVHRSTGRTKMLKPAEGQECSPCHDDLADQIKAKKHHTLAEGALACSQCHSFHGTTEKKLLNKPQGELCAECHGADVPRPDSHKSKSFRLKHKADAKGKQDECLMCHEQESFCNRCHSVKIPHAENFAEKHEREAKAKPTACLNCHDTRFCGQCHDPLPKPFDKMTKEGGAK
ncbi:MAG: hypothetical protein HZB16_19455 [Armatimonadetes bacterium]|nr:hypothetical protein [Armatimonadota bacterium]